MLRTLTTLCVERRAIVFAFVLTVAAVGLHAYRETPVEAYPDVTNLQVTVLAQMAGLAPEEVERQLTIPLERVLNGTPGMIQLRSESHFGLSMVILVFDDDADVFKSRTLVGERVAAASLPEGVVARLAPNATPLGKIFQYRMVSDRHAAPDLRFEHDWNVVPTLKQVPGVADVISFGGVRKEYHVLVDPTRLLAHNLTLKDVVDALSRSNQNVGGGILTQGDQALAIRGIGYLREPRELLDVVLRAEGGTPVSVRDIAQLVQSYTPLLGTVGYEDDMQATEGYVLLRRGENPSTVLAGIDEKLRQLNDGGLPAGMKIETFYNRSNLIGVTLSTVLHNLFYGAVLVVVVVFLFLRSLRCSIIVAVIIPLALLGAFIGLWLLGLPANLISLGAIDFGILVDAAVVLVENVLHRVKHERPPDRDALSKLVIESTVQVARAALFAMLIITTALLPIFLLQRIEGRIFRPLALTYAFALVAALALSLTLVPSLASVLLRRQPAVEEFRWLAVVRQTHARLLSWIYPRRRLVAGSFAALLTVAALTGSRLGSEFLPELDEGDIMVFAEMPASISLDEGARTLREIRTRLRVFPEVLAILSEQGRPEDGTDNESINLGKILIRLKPRDEFRKGWDKRRLVEAMRRSCAEIPGIQFNFSQPIRDAVEESVSGARGQVVLKIFGPDLPLMRKTLKQAALLLASVDGVVDLDLYRDAQVPQVHIAVDRPALARAGISVGDALDTVEEALSGQVVGSLWQGERPIDIRVRLPPAERSNLDRIGEILLAGADGARVPLRTLAAIEIGSGRASILREDNRRFMALKFNVQGRDVGSVVEDARRLIARELTAPEGHKFAWTGEFENQHRATKRLRVVVPITVLLVFALLYFGLGSFRAAFAVMAVAPFAMTGGMLALWLTGTTLSVSAAIGFITLLGQVSLASLLVVAAANARLASGQSIDEAVQGGSRDLLRAVLMTTLLAMLGLMPMALSTAIGSETQRPFAIVIIGGLGTAVLVVALALPTVYGLLLATKKRVRAP
jgi:cobalt-zinc-cadmium resistance protein CzcA